MAGFVNPDDFTVTWLDPINWMLEHPIRWVGNHGDEITIEAGFITDFATVPWFAQWLLPKTGTWTLAATAHDKLCTLVNDRYREVCRQADAQFDLYLGEIPYRTCKKEAQQAVPLCTFGPVDTDGSFRAICEDEHVDFTRRWLLWIGVRWGALLNPARRVGWWRTAHLVLPITAGLGYVLWETVTGLAWLVCKARGLL